MKYLGYILLFVAVCVYADVDKFIGVTIDDSSTIIGVSGVELVIGETNASSGGVPFLSGWDKRIKITIDSSVVDAPLTNFPVMVKISTASGIGDVDTTTVFDEVSSNSLKIAVTTGTGTNELYAEVEKWDFTGTNAWLWFKAPLIASASNTEFYLYYDNDHADNTNYVGITGSDVATNVWDDKYEGVWHISETGTVARLDSTKSKGDAATQNYSGDEAVDAKVDGGDDLDGVNNHLKLDNSFQLSITPDITISAIVRGDSFSETKRVVHKNNAYTLYIANNEGGSYGLNLYVYLGSVAYSGSLPSTDAWCQLAGTYSSSAEHLTTYTNGLQATQSAETGSIPQNGNPVKPFKVLGYTLAPSADENTLIRFSADSGTTFFAEAIFASKKNKATAGGEGTDFIFNVGTRISASVWSPAAGRTVAVSLEILEL